jgi:hypothetical protein
VDGKELADATPTKEEGQLYIVNTENQSKVGSLEYVISLNNIAGI